MKTLTESQIKTIAKEHANNVCSPGAANSEAHNVNVITWAIREALLLLKKSQK